MTTTAKIAAAAEAAEGLHITFGELLVSLTAVLLAVVTVALVVVSAKLVKATTAAATAELSKVAQSATGDMAEVATAATDDMAEVAKAAITHSAPRPPHVARPVRRWTETRKV